MPPFEAAIEAMREVSGAVIAIVLVLCAVFVPVAFLGGIAGQLYRQFAVTRRHRGGDLGLHRAHAHAGAVRAAAEAAAPRVALFRPFNRGFAWLTRRFLGGVELRAAQRRSLSLRRLPRRDRAVRRAVPGRARAASCRPRTRATSSASIMLPDGATLERTRQDRRRAAEDRRRTNPAVEHVFVIPGFDLIGGGNKTNAATMFIPLKHWDERSTSAGSGVARDVAQKGAQLRDGMALAFNPPAIRGLGTAGGFEVYLQARTNADPQQLCQVTQAFIDGRCARHPELTGINSFFRPTVPQLMVEVDREKAISLGVPVQDVFDALQSTMASSAHVPQLLVESIARRRSRSACRSPTSSTRCRARWARST